MNRTTLVGTRGVGRSLMGELMTRVVLTSTDMSAQETGVGHVALLLHTYRRRRVTCKVRI